MQETIDVVQQQLDAPPEDFPPEYHVIDEKPMVIGPENMIIPKCCREGLPDCPHIPKKQRPVKRNIGM